MLGVQLFPWQKWLLIHALELHPDGGLRFRTIVVLVARQNGKSTVSVVLALWFMYVYGFDLVLGTAQDLDTAEEIWQSAVDLVLEVDDDDVPVRPELVDLYKRTVMVNGKKSLDLITGARYKAKAANRRAGRGLSGDLVMLDELREHQTWDAWAAITKTTNARDEAQIWGFSNMGDRLSVVLNYLRAQAHAALGDPDGLNRESPAVKVAEDELSTADLDQLQDLDEDTLAIFEWSSTPGCSVHDRDEWAQANPSLGYVITERTIAAGVRTDPEAVTRTEVLCQAVEDLAETALDLDLWRALKAEDAVRGHQQAYAIATEPDREWSAIAVAWHRPDGQRQVQVVDYRPDATWVADRLALARAAHPGPVAADTAARGLVRDAEEPSEQDQAQAENALSDAMLAGTFVHGNQASLNTAVRGTRWTPFGNTRRLQRRGDIDISPVRAAALALQLLGEHVDPMDQIG